MLADKETQCSSRSQGSKSKYCPDHGREYGALTSAYKAASNRVDALEPAIQRARAGVSVLGTVSAVDEAIALANKYLDNVGEELDRRETHHKRFFQEGKLECVASGGRGLSLETRPQVPL